MKKLFLIITSILLVFVLGACSNQSTNDSDGSTSSQNKSERNESESSSSGNSNEISTGKTLIVYFSATGNTKKVAEYISSVTDGETFEVIPAKPYTDKDLNWTDEGSRVVYEHNNPDERTVPLVATTVDNFDEYDTVFIGYPIWWGISAWPINNFIKSNDFTGKTVIPFGTSSSSDLGESGKLLKEEAGSGNWLEGIRFSSGVSETEVTEWLKSIGF